MDLIRKQCQKVYGPGRFLSMDESPALFKGCEHFRQYIKTKRACFGLKLYELTLDGIAVDVLVYCGTACSFRKALSIKICLPQSTYR